MTLTWPLLDYWRSKIHTLRVNFQYRKLLSVLHFAWKRRFTQIKTTTRLLQCQLYCTNRDWCDFVLQTEKDMHIERIHKDTSWWATILDKLEAFYFSALLPELACPRHHRGIREPTAQSKASLSTELIHTYLVAVS